MPERIYEVSGQHNNTSFITEATQEPVCPGCLNLKDKWSLALQGKKIKRRNLDVSYTYDGFMVVSRRFLELYRAHRLVGLRINPLPDDREFAVVRPTESVPFDEEATLTEYEDQCPVCGQWDSITCVDPIYVRKSARVEPGSFVRTDFEFATHEEKTPIVICREHVREILEAGDLKGLVTNEVFFGH